MDKSYEKEHNEEILMEGVAMEREFTSEDLQKNKTMAALGYLVFFVPLITCKDSKLGKYCANQGLLLAIIMVLVRLVFHPFHVIPLIGWLFELVGGLAFLGVLLIALVCFLQLMSNDRVIELPYVGKIRLIK